MFLVIKSSVICKFMLAPSFTVMELEPTESNVKALLDMENGHALFRDVAGNVDELTFDAVAEHIVYAFRTDPGKEREQPPYAPTWKKTTNTRQNYNEWD